MIPDAAERHVHARLNKLNSTPTSTTSNAQHFAIAKIEKNEAGIGTL